MKSNALTRILLIIEDSHLALTLQVVLREHGNVVRWESNSRGAMKAIREFQPDAMLTASPLAVFISSRHSAEIVEFPTPVDTVELQRVLESRFGH